jgi:integrase
MEDWLNLAITISRKPLRPSSYGVYLSMWRKLTGRVGDSFALEQRLSHDVLLAALLEAGAYSSQRRSFLLLRWVVTTLRDAGQPIQADLERLDVRYKQDSRPVRQACALESLKSRLLEQVSLQFKGDKRLRLRAVVYLLCETGIRTKELVALETYNLRRGEEGAHYVQIGKGATTRQLALSPDAWAAVQAWLARRPPGISLLFCNDKGMPLDPSTVWRQLRKVGALPEISVLSVGTGLIRTAKAGDLKSSGLTDESIRQALGHRLTASTSELLERIRPVALDNG